LTPWSTFGSLGTYFGVRYAGRPPGREHRFGHEKGEAVAEVGPASVLQIVEGGDEAVERTKRPSRGRREAPSSDAQTFAFALRFSRRRKCATVCVASRT
jgi:hypothetical protein